MGYRRKIFVVLLPFLLWAVAFSSTKVFNSLESVKIKGGAIYLYGRLPWGYVDTEVFKQPYRFVVHLFNAKNDTGLGEILVTPIPYIRKIRVDYDPKVKETRVVVYPENGVELRLFRMGRLIKLEPVPVVASPVSVEASKGQRVTLEFKDADIRDVINILTEISGVNFVVDPEVKGTVTIRLRNVPWKKALEVILKSAGLGMIDEGDNIVRIGPIDKINRELSRRAQMEKILEEVTPIRTRIFELDYANADEIKPLVESMLAYGKGTSKGKLKKGVEVIKRLNALLVRGTEEDLKRIDKFLQKADTPIPQVHISARIVEISTNKLNSLGLQWGFSFSQQETPYNFPYSISTQGTVDLGFVGGLTGGNPAGTLVTTLLNRRQTFSLNVQLSALESKGFAKIVSNPKVITMDNKEAEISQGYEIPYSTYSDQGTNVEFKEATLKLKVTPHVTSKGDIILDVEVSKDSPDFAHITPDGVPIQTRTVKTRVRLKNGETLVIGGIYEMSQQRDYSGVPVLGRLPILKWLFGRSYSSSDKKELLIFITPDIVKYNRSLEED